MPMQRLLHRDSRHHRVAAVRADKHQDLGRRLPLRRWLFCLRQARDVGRGVAQGDELSAARQRDRIVKGAVPALIGHIESSPEMNLSDDGQISLINSHRLISLTRSSTARNRLRLKANFVSGFKLIWVVQS
jgi:hypothetical protein